MRLPQDEDNPMAQLDDAGDKDAEAEWLPLGGSGEGVRFIGTVKKYDRARRAGLITSSELPAECHGEASFDSMANAPTGCEGMQVEFSIGSTDPKTGRAQARDIAWQQAIGQRQPGRTGSGAASGEGSNPQQAAAAASSASGEGQGGPGAPSGVILAREAF